MSRKFSDSEIRAYSKNRFEEKLLRRRLDKLKESAGVFHDASSKQRQDLVAECKDIRKTTGESQTPNGFVLDTNFDISKRVTRPWAYSVMETTYNAAYLDAIIPLPKQSRHRPRSGASRGMLSRSSISSNRVMSSKSYSSSVKSVMTTRSDNTLQRLAPPNINRSVSNPEIHTFHAVKNETVIKIDNTHANDIRSEETDAVSRDNEKSSSDKHNTNDSHTFQNTLYVNSGSEVEVETVTEIHDGNDRTNAFVPLEERKVDTRIITLPPMYKIDSKAYQDAERERAVTRSRSRVSFSSFVGVHELQDEQRPKSKSSSDTKRPSSETRNKEQDNHGKAELEKDNNITEESMKENDKNDKNAKTVATFDPDTMVDVQVRKNDAVVYRGRRLRNYIKPEERYKLDPLVMKRRQNKMDKLAKESVSFLKRVNHENIRVEIAFPRSARKRIMTKLVQENNCGKNKIVQDDNGPVIRKKVEYFMNSMSEYIHQQQLEREQYFH